MAKRPKKTKSTRSKKTSVPRGSPDEIKFDYLKTEQFRNIHVDGAFGGLTPQGYIAMAIYSERLPIPQQTSHPIRSDEQLEEETRSKRVSRQAIIRDLEANLLMDVETASRIVKWLQEKIDAWKELQPAHLEKLEKGEQDGKG